MTKASIVLLVLQLCNVLSINVIAILAYMTVSQTQYVTWADSDPKKGEGAFTNPINSSLKMCDRVEHLYTTRKDLCNHLRCPVPTPIGSWYFSIVLTSVYCLMSTVSPVLIHSHLYKFIHV